MLQNRARRYWQTKRVDSPVRGRVAYGKRGAAGYERRYRRCLKSHRAGREAATHVGPETRSAGGPIPIFDSRGVGVCVCRLSVLDTTTWVHIALTAG